MIHPSWELHHERAARVLAHPRMQSQVSHTAYICMSDNLPHTRAPARGRRAPSGTWAVSSTNESSTIVTTTETTARAHSSGLGARGAGQVPSAAVLADGKFTSAARPRAAAPPCCSPPVLRSLAGEEDEPSVKDSTCMCSAPWWCVRTPGTNSLPPERPIYILYRY